ncbi:MAG: outer membrane beta-barrel protein [Planctomycetes bacterium]|nr:outer membrane beta-barrel protein [Planctomycetota bacterium]
MPAPVPFCLPRHVARPLLTCLGVFLVAPALIPELAAAELVVRNLYADLELLPADFDYELDDGVLTRSGSDSFDQVIGLAVGARYSFASTGDSHGFLIGGQVTVAQGTYGSVGHLTDYGLRVEGGYGYAISDSWMLNLLLRGGYGWATFDMTDNVNFSAVSLSGSGITYGAAVGLDYVVSDNWQISVSGGWQTTSYDLSGAGVDATVDRAGFCASLGFLYRLSNQPSPLE